MAKRRMKALMRMMERWEDMTDLEEQLGDATIRQGAVCCCRICWHEQLAGEATPDERWGDWKESSGGPSDLS